MLAKEILLVKTGKHFHSQSLEGPFLLSLYYLVCRNKAGGGSPGVWAVSASCARCSQAWRQLLDSCHCYTQRFLFAPSCLSCLFLYAIKWFLCAIIQCILALVKFYHLKMYWSCTVIGHIWIWMARNIHKCYIKLHYSLSLSSLEKFGSGQSWHFKLTLTRFEVWIQTVEHCNWDMN